MIKISGYVYQHLSEFSDRPSHVFSHSKQENPDYILLGEHTIEYMQPADTDAIARHVEMLEGIKKRMIAEKEFAIKGINDRIQSFLAITMD